MDVRPDSHTIRPRTPRKLRQEDPEGAYYKAGPPALSTGTTRAPERTDGFSQWARAKYPEGTSSGTCAPWKRIVRPARRSWPGHIPRWISSLFDVEDEIMAE